MPNHTLLRRRAGHVISESECHLPPPSQSFTLAVYAAAWCVHWFKVEDFLLASIRF